MPVVYFIEETSKVYTRKKVPPIWGGTFLNGSVRFENRIKATGDGVETLIFAPQKYKRIPDVLPQNEQCKELITAPHE